MSSFRECFNRFWECIKLLRVIVEVLEIFGVTESVLIGFESVSNVTESDCRGIGRFSSY